MVFWITGLIYFMGCVTYLLWGSAEPLSWSNEVQEDLQVDENSPACNLLSDEDNGSM